MKYNTAEPYFSPEDIEGIIREFRYILEGNGMFTKGPNVKNFEECFAGYVGTKYGVAVNSGTSALEIVLKAIGIGSGDEVIVPVQTFVATGSCVNINCGTPVFCEIDMNYLLDYEYLKTKITDRTRAVIIVHFAGLIHPRIFEIKEYLKQRDIYLIEDAAHAHGAKIDDTFAGAIGDFGCFSFYSTKVITTAGEGGMITMNDEEHFELCKSYRNIGIDTRAETEIFSNIGSNNRMNEIQAILGQYQLKRLDDFLEHRNKIAQIYKTKLRGLEKKRIIYFQDAPSSIRHSYWRFVIVLNNAKCGREEIKAEMEKRGIKIDWPYQPLMHLQPVYKKLYGIKEGHLKKSEEYAKNHFCLPIHLGIKQDDAVFIAKELSRVLG
jgi:perosamine synthetase